MRGSACVLGGEKKKGKREHLTNLFPRCSFTCQYCTVTLKHGATFCVPSLRSSLLSWALASLTEGRTALVSEPEGPATARRREHFHRKVVPARWQGRKGDSKVRKASGKSSVFHFCSSLRGVGIIISARQTRGSALWGIF